MLGDRHSAFLVPPRLAREGAKEPISPGRNTRLMTTDLDGLKSQARDISFLIENFKKALQLDPQNYIAMDQLKALN